MTTPAPVVLTGGGQLSADTSGVARRIAEALAARCDANHDEEAIKSWLDVRASASAQTRRAYEREARRLLAWLMWQKGADDQVLPLATTPEATTFLHWLLNPESSLVPGEILARAGLPGKQPVKNGLSDSSLLHAAAVLNSLYQHLNSLRAPWGPYAPFNPFAALKRGVARGVKTGLDGSPLPRLARRAGTAADGPAGKALSVSLWSEVLATVELMPRTSPAQIERYWQTWWIVRLQYHSVFRRFESVNARMADVVLTRTGYELQVVGKGNKAASIVMTDVFVRDLITYRRALGLAPMPDPRETGPLILHASPARRAAGAHISELTLYRRVTDVFEATANRIEPLEASAADVQRLRSATLHGIRHTGITHMLDAGVSMRTTSRLARHSSPATTSLYDSLEKETQVQELNRGANKLQVEQAQQLARQPGNKPNDVGESPA